MMALELDEVAHLVLVVPLQRAELPDQVHVLGRQRVPVCRIRSA
jgi:hypothetical protein